MRKALRPCLVTLVPLLVGACEPAQVADQHFAPPPAGLEGRWRYDSTGATLYRPDGTFCGKGATPMRAGAVLTIGLRSWVYSGSLSEVHDYTRTGAVLHLRRIGTPRMLQLGYITPDAVGRPVFADTMAIWRLTPRQLILRDSTGAIDPNAYCEGFPGAGVSVHWYYYSR